MNVERNALVMKIMITGGNDQLGMDCVSVFRKAHEVVSVGLDEADITQLPEVERLVQTFTPDIHSMYHCAIPYTSKKAKRFYIGKPLS